jgi:hypothetical protein
MGANNRFREWLRGLIDTAESDLEVSLTPWDYEIFYKYVQVRSHGVIGNAGSDLVMSYLRKFFIYYEFYKHVESAKLYVF